VYVFAQSGALVRYDLDTGKSETIWPGPPALAHGGVYVLDDGRTAVSPDGQTVAIVLVGIRYYREISTKSSFLTVFVAPAEPASGGRAGARELSSSPVLGSRFGLAWSADSISLCVAVPATGEYPTISGPEGPPDLWLMRWQRGEASPVTSVQRVWPNETVAGLRPLPKSDRFVLETFGETSVVDANAELQPLPERLRLLTRGNLLGFDAQDRAILQLYGEETSGIAALDIHTGKLTDIYP
jgi:hypothetical protein